MRLLLLLASALLALPALAQTPGSCEVGTAQAFLDVSDVQASLFNDGALFFGGSTTAGNGYLMPKDSGNSPLFATALWLGGKVNGEVRVSHSRYGNRQMWPGPLNVDGTLPNPNDCSTYDRIYTVSTYDVAIYDETGFASSDLTDWPVGLGAPAVDAGGQPMVVTSREQTLDLRAGERPVISGTQTAFWVMNDVGNARFDSVYNAETQTWEQVEVPPLGVEVVVTAFAVVNEDAAMHQGTFYRYTVTNRNTHPITDAYAGFYVDPDLGSSHDDYVGVDTTRGLAFGYNASDRDDVYGSPPPAIGVDLLDGLGAFRWEADIGNNGVGAVESVYNTLQGLWYDGTEVTEMDYGYQQGGPATRYAFAGDPVTGAFWSMMNLDGREQRALDTDQKMTLGSDRFALQPGESKTFGLAVLFAQGTGHLDSITQLRAASDRVQAAYDNGTLGTPSTLTGLLTTPQLRHPAPGVAVYDSTLAFAWTPSLNAQRYRLEISRSPDFDPFDPAETMRLLVSSAMPEIVLPDAMVGEEPATYYWRVRAESDTRRSQLSEVQTFTYYRYIPRPWVLRNGAPAIVEVVGPGGVDPCGPQALTTTGCDEVNGHAVFETLNSTGDYTLETQSPNVWRNLHRYAMEPANDFEIRMSGSSLAHATTRSFSLTEPDSTTERIIEVPFELWDIGPTRPGNENNPEDDIRLIPVLWSPGSFWVDGDFSDDPCEFQYSTHVWGYSYPARYDTLRATKSLNGYYPSTSYNAFEDYASNLFDADAARCPEVPRESIGGFLQDRVPPLRLIQLSDPSPDQRGTTGDLQGTVIRFYTTDPFPVADEAIPRAGALTLGPAYPNPTASSRSVQIPYRLASSSPVELAVYDVLGRRIIELVNASQPEGTHTAQLDASALAPGIYIAWLQVGTETRTARITIVR
ncbi:MAG: hypothetical protein Rubg2KO_23040 [Rubricoccaceae bacterium]